MCNPRNTATGFLQLGFSHCTFGLCIIPTYRENTSPDSELKLSIRSLEEQKLQVVIFLVKANNLACSELPQEFLESLARSATLALHAD